MASSLLATELVRFTIWIPVSFVLTFRTELAEGPVEGITPAHPASKTASDPGRNIRTKPAHGHHPHTFLFNSPTRKPISRPQRPRTFPFSSGRNGGMDRKSLKIMRK
jgi:hypothetical protein